MEEKRLCEKVKGKSGAPVTAGGSFYILILIVGLDLKWKITRSGSRIPWEVAKMLRRPETSSKSRLAPLFQTELIAS